MHRALKIGIAAVLAVVVVVVGGTWLYINVIKEDAPERLTLTAATTTVPATSAGTQASSTSTATARSGLDGRWVATGASEVGYRVKEILFGQDTEGVGRTNAVTGAIEIDGATITTGEFTVDMTTLKSDQGRRDNQFNGRIMQTATYPEATFRITEPIELGSVPGDLEPVSTTATGELTLKGTTKPVTIEVQAQRNASTIEVNGAYDVVFADWGIDNPSFGGVTTEDHGLLEFLLVFAPA